MTGLVEMLLVGVGGSVGAISRHVVGLSIEGREATTLVNVLGSFVLGLLLGGGLDGGLMLFVGVGFCGAFTTFSSFIIELVTTAERGELPAATWFGIVNLAGAVGALLLGTVVPGML